MPKISDDKEAEYIERIRSIIVRRPDVTISQIQELLEMAKSPISLSRQYTHNLVRKIRKNRAQRLNHYTLNLVLGKFEHEAEELKKKLWTIADSQMSTDKDKIAAMRELRSTSEALFDKMFDSGFFKRNLGKTETEYTLSEESQALIDKAIKHGYGERDKKDSGKPTGEIDPARK